jgi:hypothetical protein
MSNVSIKKLVALKEAAKWASSYTGHEVTSSNISYLLQYAKVHAYDSEGKLKAKISGMSLISLEELKHYYDGINKQEYWKKVLGDTINWNLSFDDIKESVRTKHVHRLHPYKGKFIPQLVEYFLDDHVNDFKKEAYFHAGDTILDPFAGSGTTLVQCMELGLNSVGIDISKFNCMISKVKTQKYDLGRLGNVLRRAAKLTADYSKSNLDSTHENDIEQLLSSFNRKYYPNPQFKFLLYGLRDFENKVESEFETSTTHNEENKAVIEAILAKYEKQRAILEKEVEAFRRCNGASISFKISADSIHGLSNRFSEEYERSVLKWLSEEISKVPKHKQTKLDFVSRQDNINSPFLSRWFVERQRLEMKYYLTLINNEPDPPIQDLMRIILSRTIRSCRATSHSDLATLVKPQSEPYYCPKHFKICKPVTTITKHLCRYTEDTIKRIVEFSKIKKDVFCEIINADSRTINIFEAIKNEDFLRVLKRKRIDGIFSSPPYVGQIDYHEQHAYSYELFGINRKDDLEIGRQANGTGKKAQDDYVQGISEVLLNVSKFLKPDASIFIVANDSRNLYRRIADESNLEIIQEFKRPVLNRTERDKQPYSESIFLMKCQ